MVLEWALGAGSAPELLPSLACTAQVAQVKGRISSSSHLWADSKPGRAGALWAELLAFLDRAGRSSALLCGMLVCFQCFTGDASFPGLQSHCLLFWDCHYSCPQNPLPDKAHGAFMQEIVPFFVLFFAVLIAFSPVLFA